jgi:hypothetical protein
MSLRRGLARQSVEAIAGLRRQAEGRRRGECRP